MRDEGGHGACVDEWLTKAESERSSAQLLELLELGLNALWKRTNTTLGEVTLTAIMDRVLHTASGRFSFLAEVRVDPAVGVSCSQLRVQIGSLDAIKLNQAVRFVLVEFLTVLGNLTAEILTPALHAELSRVALPKADDPKESCETAEPAQRRSAPEQTHDEEN